MELLYHLLYLYAVTIFLTKPLKYILTVGFSSILLYSSVFQQKSLCVATLGRIFRTPLVPFWYAMTVLSQPGYSYYQQTSFFLCLFYPTYPMPVAVMLCSNDLHPTSITIQESYLRSTSVLYVANNL